MSEGRTAICRACGRVLRAPASVEARIGPVCKDKRDREAAKAALSELAV